MYKILICWRYLLTRYLALACVVSVMLGVATLIVVNSVMGGFSSKLRDRLHGLLSDIVIESNSMDGFPNPQIMMEAIRNDSQLKDKVVAMTPTMEVFAMLQYRLPNDQMMTRTIRLVGIDPKSRSDVGGFKEHLVKQKQSRVPSFALSPKQRELYFFRHRFAKGDDPALDFQPRDPNVPPPPAPPERKVKEPQGIVVGHLLAHYRQHNKQTGKIDERTLINYGDDVIITTVSGGKISPVYDSFVVNDYFKSEMSEYDSNYAYVSLEYLQKLRSLENRVTSLQIRLKDYERDSEFVKNRLAVLLPKGSFYVSTWEDKQGPLLAAISIERGILNVLLFMIICVAGFGILAIFSMIVAEKTRDIGILKALGASNGGVLSIFLTYGLLLGIVGAILGTILGVSIANHINDVEMFLTKITGQKVFDRSVYYFDEIPTEIQPFQIFLLNAGAVGIAVLFSVLPALRASMLHPVRALRYE
ncbi:MAG: ABC transporter permease [Gemmataceae bacterium]